MFRADQQAFLDHHETQLSKMLNTVTEWLGSLKLKKEWELDFFHALLRMQDEASSQDDTVDVQENFN